MRANDYYRVFINIQCVLVKGFFLEHIAFVKPLASNIFAILGLIIFYSHYRPGSGLMDYTITLVLVGQKVCF